VVFNFFVPKAYLLKVLDGALFIWILWVVFLELPNLKNDINYIKYKFSHRFEKGLYVIDNVLFKD
jgi:hypothetical protein